MEVPQTCAPYQLLFWKIVFGKILFPFWDQICNHFQLLFIRVQIKCRSLPKLRGKKKTTHTTKKQVPKRWQNCNKIYQYSGRSTSKLNIMPKDFSLPSLGNFVPQDSFPSGCHSLMLLLFEARELLRYVTASENYTSLESWRVITL